MLLLLDESGDFLNSGSLCEAHIHDGMEVCRSRYYCLTCRVEQVCNCEAILVSYRVWGHRFSGFRMMPSQLVLDHRHAAPHRDDERWFWEGCSATWVLASLPDPRHAVASPVHTLPTQGISAMPEAVDWVKITALAPKYIR